MSSVIAQLRAQTSLLSRPQLANLLECQVGTLAAWVVRNRGPAFIKVGAAVRYNPADVADWLEAQTVKPLQPAPAPRPELTPPTPMPSWLQATRAKSSITSGF